MSGPYDQQIFAQGAGLLGGQTVTQSTSIQRTTEVVHGQAQQQQSAPRSDRQRVAHSDSSTSLSSSTSERIQKTSGGNNTAQAMSGVYQQYSTGNGYAYAAPATVSYVAATGPAYVQSGGSFTSLAAPPRRQGRFQRQVIRLPEPGPGPVRQVRQRLATPEPDTLERVYIQRAANEVIEEITEVPTTPPPRVQERTVVEPAGPPQVIKRVIRVPPRGGGYQQQSAVYVGGNYQAASNLLSAGSYGNVQQAAASYQQYAAPAPVYAAPTYAAPAYATSASFSTGYAAAPASYGASSYGGGYGSYGGGYGSYGGGYSSQPAFCFQV